LRAGRNDYQSCFTNQDSGPAGGQRHFNCFANAGAYADTIPYAYYHADANPHADAHAYSAAVDHCGGPARRPPEYAGAPG
jgi:hypothetical protein